MCGGWRPGRRCRTRVTGRRRWRWLWSCTPGRALLCGCRPASCSLRCPPRWQPPLPGMIAGRRDRKRTMIICDLPGAAAYAAMAVTGSPLGLITLGALAALLHSPSGPASRAAVPDLAGDGDLARANGTLAAASDAGQLAGPAPGGVLCAGAGAGGAFAANDLVRRLRGSDRGGAAGSAARPRTRNRAPRRRAASGRAPVSCGATARC
jgi:Major Facilitator Superfamily